MRAARQLEGRRRAEFDRRSGKERRRGERRLIPISELDNECRAREGTTTAVISDPHGSQVDWTASAGGEPNPASVRAVMPRGRAAYLFIAVTATAMALSIGLLLGR